MLKPYSGVLTSASPSVFSSSEGTQPTITSALTHWKSARSLLSRTIQTYLAACTGLRASYATHGRQLVEQSLVQEALITIDSELESLASEEEMLCGMRTSLAAMRNTSAKFARINTFPPEVLVKIFRTLGISCVRDSHPELAGFAGVCVYWREIALSMADLWAHVDVGPDVPQTVTRYLLSLSKNNPIHIHAVEPVLEGDEDDPNEYVCNRAAKTIVMMLSPHLPRVCTLEIKSNSNDGRFVSSLLDIWFKCSGSLGSLRALLIDRPEVRDPILLPRNLEGVVSALNSLRLAEVMFNWESNAYHGLVDLQMDFAYSGISISMLQLASILSASPALVTLKLGWMWVENMEGQIASSPIVMGCLEVVNLVNMGRDDAIALLSLITMPVHAELSMRLWTEDRTDERLLDFFARSNITTFYCDGNYISHSWKHEFWSSLRFHTMILYGVNLGTASFVQPGARPTSLNLSPLPSSVTLLGCMVTFESLNCLVIESATRDLRLEQCTVSIASDQEMAAIRESLLELYPDLRCSISDTDSTQRLRCRALLFGR
ncbi:hypothetical protein FRC12_012156 [Ceratobasidium sp. 428]|nr:hypothetical protein FRC12_012156 [Ceratobasidium sp. 428]